MSPIRRLLFLLLLLIGPAPLGTSARAETKRGPNIVLFLVDDMSWGDSSVYGATNMRTPNMEKLATEGMTFSHAFVASPSCAPSRAALLTGLDPMRNGAMRNHARPRPEIKKWPAYFKELGYETAAIGKTAHYAQVQEYGFDHASHFKYHQDDCVEAAVKWLDERDSSAPLCLIVGTNWPHVPWPKQTTLDPNGLRIPPTHVDTKETREAWTRYLAAVALADRDLGQLREAAEQKLGPDTLFIFSSDHGSQFPFGKWNGYDAGVRTPMIVAWPGRVKPGAKSDAMVSWIDILPTCIDAAGGAPPSGISGRSFLPVLRGERKAHRSEIFITHSADGEMNQYPLRALRTRNWKYIRNLDPSAEHHSHVDRGSNPEADGRIYWDAWVRRAASDPAAASIIHRYHHRPAEELYDLRSDPYELKNLAMDATQAARLKQMREKVSDWMRDQGDLGLPETERTPGER